ncbi:membrane protein [Knoellia sinensis KCTC 19936]|uniref:Membrane protein n=2 Tax=Knoellia TaxID=136099 RepID=A0A0A0J0P7_9MICO|nr:membrane protein [Knoellia sinensis KCTC 19936]
MVLTVRGRRVVLILVVLAVLLIALTIRAVVSDARPVTKPPAPLASSTASNATPSPTTPTSPAAKPSPPPSATPRPTTSPSVKSTTSTGILRSGLVGSGKFTTSTWAKPAGSKTATVHEFVVKVEGGVKADPDDVAQQVHAILNDPRGWTGHKGASFAAVADPAKADFVVHVASPPTTNRMCAPLKVGGKWSCAAQRNIVLNSDRWLLMTPTYDDLGDYRAYMVNHEVGHFLGRGHVSCPKAGAPAPVMLQQSISLGGCRPNAWPKTPSAAS